MKDKWKKSINRYTITFFTCSPPEVKTGISSVVTRDPESGDSVTEHFDEDGKLTENSEVTDDGIRRTYFNADGSVRNIIHEPLGQDIDDDVQEEFFDEYEDEFEDETWDYDEYDENGRVIRLTGKNENNQILIHEYKYDSKIQKIQRFKGFKDSKIQMLLGRS